MAKNTYSIFLETEKGLLSIPCGKLEDIDNYTKRFKDRNEFLNVLIKMLKLPIEISEIGVVCLSTYNKKDYKFDYERCLPILYNEDNYDLDSLVGYFGDYLKQSRSRLGMFENVHMVINGYDSGNYTDKDIEFFSRVYLNKKYRNHREMYSLLRDVYNIRKKKFAKRENQSYLSKSRIVDYVDSLFPLSAYNKDKFEISLDELSRIDLEELSLLLCGESHAFSDEPYDPFFPNKEDIEGIQKITGTSLEELQLKCNSQITKRHRK